MRTRFEARQKSLGNGISKLMINTDLAVPAFYGSRKVSHGRLDTLLYRAVKQTTETMSLAPQKIIAVTL